MIKDIDANNNDKEWGEWVSLTKSIFEKKYLKKEPFMSTEKFVVEMHPLTQLIHFSLKPIPSKSCSRKSHLMLSKAFSK